MNREPSNLNLVLHYHRYGHAHAGAQLVQCGGVGVDLYLNRHTLNNLNKVAGSVIGWQQRELGAGSRRKVINAAVQFQIGVRIHINVTLLPGADIIQLGFFKVGGDINAAVVHNIEQRLPGLYQLA